MEFSGGTKLIKTQKKVIFVEFPLFSCLHAYLFASCLLVWDCLLVLVFMSSCWLVSVYLITPFCSFVCLLVWLIDWFFFCFSFDRLVACFLVLYFPYLLVGFFVSGFYLSIQPFISLQFILFHFVSFHFTKCFCCFNTLFYVSSSSSVEMEMQLSRWLTDIK